MLFVLCLPAQGSLGFCFFFPFFAIIAIKYFPPGELYAYYNVSVSTALCFCTLIAEPPQPVRSPEVDAEEVEPASSFCFCVCSCCQGALTGTRKKKEKWVYLRRGTWTSHPRIFLQSPL